METRKSLFNFEVRALLTPRPCLSSAVSPCPPPDEPAPSVTMSSLTPPHLHTVHPGRCCRRHHQPGHPGPGRWVAAPRDECVSACCACCALVQGCLGLASGFKETVRPVATCILYALPREGRPCPLTRTSTLPKASHTHAPTPCCPIGPTLNRSGPREDGPSAEGAVRGVQPGGQARHRHAVRATLRRLPPLPPHSITSQHSSYAQPTVRHPIASGPAAM